MSLSSYIQSKKYTDNKVLEVATGGASLATESSNGLLSASDKTKLNTVATGANNYTHPTGDGNSHVPPTGVSNANKVLKSGSTTNSAAWGNVDWSELLNKPSTFPPPIATASVLGGVKIGSGITVDASGVISASGSGGTNPNAYYVEDYAGTATAKIQAAIDAAAATTTGNKKTVILADKDYYITGTITVKVGVKLQGSYGSSITIGADVRGFVIERNASLWDLKINVDFTGYSKEAIYLDGVQKFYNSLNKTRIQNINLYNWTGTVSGTGIHLYSGGTSHEVSFVDFEGIKIVGFSKGIHLKAVNPGTGMAWINANRFDKITLENNIDNIVLEGSETIPFECSGNSFTNLQIQPTDQTVNIMTIQGQYNKVNGICWDLFEILHSNPVFTFKADSNYNELDMKSIPANRITNLGKTSNRFATY